MFDAIKPSDLPARELPYSAPVADGAELFTEAQAFVLVVGDYEFRGFHVGRVVAYRVLDAAAHDGRGEAPTHMVFALRNAGIVSIIREIPSERGNTRFSLTPRGKRIASAL